MILRPAGDPPVMSRLHPQMVKVMKLTVFFLLIAIVQLHATGFSQVTLNLKNAPLEKVFREIKRQTGYDFLYTKKMLEGAPKITINVKNAPIVEVLKVCFKGQFEYTIENNTIVVIQQQSADLPAPLLPPPLISIKGRIVDENGEPVLATVMVKDNKKATGTDANGEFSLTDVADNATLVITSVGIETMEVPVNKRQNLGTIVIRRKAAVLEGVVVNKGYYSTSRQLNTGNVTKVTAATIEKQPASNPLQALQGRVAGLQIIQATGVPGGGYSVLIRGRNNLRNGTDYPLYIIDGVPYSSGPLHSELGDLITRGGNPLNLINPFDIESIEVLKDADATSIYGSRGANGVILITTKKGKAGTTKFSANVYSGYGQVAHKMKLLTTPQYLEMRNEAFTNTGQPLGPTDYDLDGTWDKNRYTDWQDVLLGGHSKILNAQVGLSGGTNKTQFYFGGGYASEGTVFPGPFGDKKISAHLNVSHGSDNGKFNAQISTTFLNDKNDLYSYDVTNDAMILPPNAPALYTPDGKLNWQSDSWANPAATLRETFGVRTNTLVSNAKFTYKVVPSLQLSVSAGYTLTGLKETHIMPLESIIPAAGYTSGESDFVTNDMKTWIVEPQAEYGFTLGKGKITALAGMTFQQSNNDRLSLHGLGFANDKLLGNIQAATTILVNSNANNNYKYQAIYGRLNYEYRQKYVINVTARRDGSSRFGPGKQFGNFGAIGAAWILGNEEFMKKFSWLSFAKIRASYGTSGNDQTPDYGFLDLWNSTSYPYNGSQGLYPRSLYNENLAWTLIKKLEAAIEIGLFNDKLFITSSFYRNTTPNQLVSISLPTLTGFASLLGNFPAIVENKGFEFDVNFVPVDRRSLRWTTNFNISFPKNKLLEFPNIESSSYAATYKIGQSLYAQNRYHFTGVDPATGLLTYEDMNHDGSITVADRAFNSEIAQKYYAGLENTLTYKGFELNFLFQYVNQTGPGYRNYFYAAPGYHINQPDIVMNRWRKPGDVTDIQAFTPLVGDAGWNAYARAADNKIVNASYLRLRSLRLAYQLPASLMQKAKIQQCKIYLQGQNLLTFTDYIGLDPEVYQSPYSSYSLPPLRILTAGIQINF